MKLKDLIGYQLVEIDDEKIVVKQYNKTFVLEIEEYDGDCCGFNNLNVTSNIENNPVITNIQYVKDDSDWGDGLKITFYGEDKELAKIDSYSSSGSGWAYGASVTVVCKDLGIDEMLTGW